MIVPFALAVMFYTFYSYKYPLNTIKSTIADEIVKVFLENTAIVISAFIPLVSYVFYKVGSLKVNKNMNITT